MKIFYFVSLLFYISSFNNGHAVERDWPFEKVKGYKSCVKCHENQYKVWKKTKHFKGYKSLTKHKDAEKIARAMGVSVKKIKKSTICAECHFTLGHKKGRPRPISGVSCESCHGPSKDWLDIHNDFGKGVKERKFESSPHRAERRKKQTELGMTFPGNIANFAKNCYGCHMVANEKLLNLSDHPIPESFDLAERTQGDLRHGPKASTSQIRKMKIIGYAVELELGLASLAKTQKGGFARAMTMRSVTALANLKAIQSNVNNAELNKLINIANTTKIVAGNSQLNSVSSKLSSMIESFSSDADGSKLAGAENHKHIKLSKTDIVKFTDKLAKISPKPEKQPKPVKPVIAETVAKPFVVKKKPAVQQVDPVVRKKREAEHRKENPSSGLAFSISNNSTASSMLGKSTTLASFDVLVPRSNSLCQSNNPWMLGTRVLNDGDGLNSKDCFSLKIKANKKSQIYFYSQSENGKAFRLFPNSCNALGKVSNRVQRNETLQLPKSSKGEITAIGLDDESGAEWLHAVAISSDEAKKSLEDLTREIPDVCDTSINAKYSAGMLQTVFSTISEHHQADFDWKTVKFLHK